MTSDEGRSKAGSGGVFRRILVGYDGSTEARHAFHIAIALAADLGGDVHALSVVRPPAHAETPEERRLALQAERENLSRGISDVSNQARYRLDVTTAIVFADDPAKAIAIHAREHGFDLVVVGVHGREQIAHRGIGHSLDALLRHLPCPVLVV